MNRTGLVERIQTGDIALDHSSTPYGLAIRAVSGYYTHARFLAVEPIDYSGTRCGIMSPNNPETRIYTYEAQLHFERGLFNLFDPNLSRIVRLKYDELFEAQYIEENRRIAHHRAQSLALIWHPYDVSMILSEALRFAIKPFGPDIARARPPFNTVNAYECSEAVAGGIWNPAWMRGVRDTHRLNFFTETGLEYSEWLTPTEIGKSKKVEVIYDATR